MFCAKCGAANAEMALSCRRCGAALEMQPGFPLAMNPPGQPLAGNFRSLAQQPMDQAFSTPESSLFAPIAHSPFNEEPLPQPSDALPALIRPVGDIMVFAPTAAMPASAQPGNLISNSPDRAASDAGSLPTNSEWPSLRDFADYPTETHMPVPLTPPMLPNYSSQPVAQVPLEMPYAPSAQGGYNNAPPAVQPVNVGGWQGNAGYQEESYADFFQAPSVSQTLGNMYPGPPDSSPLGMSSGRNGTASASGFLPAGRANAFAGPLPLWTTLAGIAAGALLLLGLVFLNPDWATGATIAGMVALILSLLLLIAGGVRVALGMLAESNPRRRSQVISSALLVLLLFLVSGVGLSQQTGLHAMQARYLEGQHSWQAAVTEYQDAGEIAPTSDNLARVYNEWGEDLSSQQQYASAVAKFATVLKQFAPLTAEVSRAKNATVATYLAWADFSARGQDYAGATAHYDTLLALNYCDSICQQLTRAKDATAYDHLAEQQFGAHHFALAVAAFQTLTTRFASSPETGQAQTHTDYAQALWSLGQQQLGATCADAIPTYQQLASQFADTTQGKQAAIALQQPVQVQGHFTQSVPGAPFNPTVFLVQSLSVGIQQYQFPPLLKSAPTAQINSDGSFSLSSVPQGTYELIWSNDGTLHFYYAFSGTQVLYTAHVGPLCTYNFGAINQAIPTTSN